MQDLKVTIVQSDIVWENSKKNLSHYEDLLKDVGETDLIILPEMFSTGFSMNSSELAESMEGNAVNWMKKIASNKKAVVTGSLIILDDSRYFNRLVWMEPDDNCLIYDKRHLFSLAQEEKHYTPGTRKIFPELNEWKMLPLICYDLRFPVWSRQSPPFTEMGVHPVDLLIYVANWPDRRIYAWKQLLIARAIENQCYVVGVNRVGNDNNGITYNGFSSIIDPMGEIIYQIENKETVFTTTLEKARLIDIRERLPFLDDRDEFELRI